MATKKQKEYGIKDLAAEVGLSECYIRRMIHKGKLQSTLRTKPGTKTPKHYITMTQFKEFRSNTSVRTSRDDGRNKFTLYMKKEEEEAIRKLLQQNDLEDIEKLLARTNKAS